MVLLRQVLYGVRTMLSVPFPLAAVRLQGNESGMLLVVGGVRARLVLGLQRHPAVHRIPVVVVVQVAVSAGAAGAVLLPSAAAGDVCCLLLPGVGADAFGGSAGVLGIHRHLWLCW